MQKKPFVGEIVSWWEEYELAPPQKRLHPYGGQIQHSPEIAEDTLRCKPCPKTADDSPRCPLCGGNTRVRIHFVHDTREDRPYWECCQTNVLGSTDCRGYQWVDEMQQGETSDTPGGFKGLVYQNLRKKMLLIIQSANEDAKYAIGKWIPTYPTLRRILAKLIGSAPGSTDTPFSRRMSAQLHFSVWADF
ncbi:hypothetical protein ACLB2K_063392 [Fragaria x ananassa]